jgi:hypothetical protein
MLIAMFLFLQISHFLIFYREESRGDSDLDEPWIMTVKGANMLLPGFHATSPTSTNHSSLSILETNPVTAVLRPKKEPQHTTPVTNNSVQNRGVTPQKNQQNGGASNKEHRQNEKQVCAILLIIVFSYFPLSIHQI